MRCARVCGNGSAAAAARSQGPATSSCSVCMSEPRVGFHLPLLELLSRWMRCAGADDCATLTAALGRASGGMRCAICAVRCARYVRCKMTMRQRQRAIDDRRYRTIGADGRIRAFVHPRICTVGSRMLSCRCLASGIWCCSAAVLQCGRTTGSYVWTINADGRDGLSVCAVSAQAQFRLSIRSGPRRRRLRPQIAQCLSLFRCRHVSVTRERDSLSLSLGWTLTYRDRSPQATQRAADEHQRRSGSSPDLLSPVGR
ncbi:hypothetical protein C8Q70DRAFT_272714 [Cubamyces menziesii]|nr:hypothetical protein C8Q70DRAFT_272714 [Cubamyces menziesii]